MSSPKKPSGNADRKSPRAYKEKRKTGHASSSRNRIIKRLPDGFKLATTSDVLGIVQTFLVAVDEEKLVKAPTLQKAKTVSVLLHVALRAIEIGKIEERLDAIEEALKKAGLRL